MSTILPVQEHAQEILAFLDKHAVSALRSTTGSGKSTLIPPLYVLHKQRRVRVLVIQPTIVSCIRTCEQVGRLFPYLRIGYGAGGVTTYNQHTEIMFTTPGHTEIKFGRLKMFDHIDLVVFDEVHTASPEYETLSLMVQSVFDSLYVRILLLSATMNDSITSSWEKIIHQKLPCFTLDVKLFPIEETFASRDYIIGDKDDEAILLNDSIQYLVNQNRTGVPGHFLVFCSGQEMIDKFYNKLYSEEFNETFGNCKVFCAYSSLPNHEINEAFSQTQPFHNERSIILSTDIAETSVTIPFVSLVLDLGHQKVMQCLEETSILTTARISKFAAKQRRGRTGRTNPGFCHRMYTKTTYDNLPLCYEAALKRTPLHQTILKLISYNFDPVRLLKHHIDNSLMITNCVKRLKYETLIESKSEGKFVLSEEAKKICYLPLTIRFARCLYMLFSQSNTCKWIGLLSIVIAEIESSMSLVYLPRRGRQECNFDYSARLAEHRDKYERFEYDSSCPLNTSVIAYMHYLRETSGMNHRNKIQWTVDNGLNNKTLTAITVLVKRLREQWRDFNVVGDTGYSNATITEFFTSDIVPIFVCRFDSMMTDMGKEKWYEDGDSTVFYRLNNRGFQYDLKWKSNRVLCLHKSLSRKNADYVTKIVSVYVNLPQDD